MTAIPKPPTGKKAGPVGPKLTEYDYLEIREKIGDAFEFKNEVEITLYAHKRHDSFKGVVKEVDGQQGKLTMQVGYEIIKINMNNIVGVK